MSKLLSGRVKQGGKWLTPEQNAVYMANRRKNESGKELDKDGEIIEEAPAEPVEAEVVEVPKEAIEEVVAEVVEEKVEKVEEVVKPKKKAGRPKKK